MALLKRGAPVSPSRRGRPAPLGVMVSRVRMLRASVTQRLSAAAEEVCALFESTIRECEQEVDRQRRLLLQDAVFPANVQKFMVMKEVPPEPKQWSPSLDREDPPESPQIKEEQEELRTSKEGVRPQGLEEAGITEFPFAPAPVKPEDDEDKPQSSQLHQRHTEQMETGADGEDCGGPEPDRNSDPDRHLQPDTDKTSRSSETEDSGDDRKHRSGLNINRVPVSDVGCNAAKKSLTCSECGERFGSKDHLLIHMKSHPGEKTFTCPFCGKKLTKSSNLTTHLRVHTGEKPFTCSVCNTSFSLRCTLVNHMRVHTGEKPFSCSVCSRSFSKKANLNTHMALHTEEKPFKCSVCDKRFTWHSQVKNHKCVDGSR